MNLIAAVSLNGVIGQGNSLPWRIPEDMKHFKNMTMGCAVIMGRRTYESIGGPLLGPLPGRANIVLSRSMNRVQPKGVRVASSVNEALYLCEGIETFVIGGAEVYKELLPLCSNLYITEVQRSFNGDTYFPLRNPSNWVELTRGEHATPEGLKYHFVHYVNKSEINLGCM